MYKWTATSLDRHTGQKVGVVTPGHHSPMIAATTKSFFNVFSITVPDDQKLADSVHINSDMRHICLTAADSELSGTTAE